jgi:MPBQ/MSBQ methyltransferase
MRDEALEHAGLDDPGLSTLDVGAGTGFTTEGIVSRVEAANVTMLDQSPHQLAHADAKPALANATKVLGDAEQLPFETDRFDRYVSAGSIEYWPHPQQGIAEAYRVLKPGGRALLIGPVEPANRILKTLASTWMLFPPEDDYRSWFTAAGFDQVTIHALAPTWYRGRATYAVAITGVKPTAGPSPAARAPLPEPPVGRVRFAARFVAGSAAGAAFVPIGAVLNRLRR